MMKTPYLILIGAVVTTVAILGQMKSKMGYRKGNGSDRNSRTKPEHWF